MTSASTSARKRATTRRTSASQSGGAAEGRGNGTTRRRGEAPRAMQTRPSGQPIARVLDARPDTADFRDLLFVPTLIEVPPVQELDDYLRYGVPILDQGTEGACTGFGLATVANFLLRRR